MIRILTDSTCDISFDEARQLNIDMLPITILFDQREYKDGIDLSNREFYAELRTCKNLPKTSQISPSAFEDYFKAHNQNDDIIIGIFLSSELSGTFQSAYLAAQTTEQDNIHLIDSLNVSIGTALLVREAVKMRDQGYSAESIVMKCNELRKRIRTIAVVENLKYLKMGGRLSTSEAMIGSLLHITPIIAVEQGSIKLIAKTRGFKSAVNLLHQMIGDYPIDTSHSFVYGNADSIENMEQLIRRTADDTKELTAHISQIGCSVGVHVGPGAIGYAYIVDQCVSEQISETSITNCA